MAANSFGKKALLFLVKFFVIYGILQFLILALPLMPLESAIAGAEAAMLGLESEGNTILFNFHRFEIVENCTGLMGISVLAAIVFALKKPGIGKKAALLAFGALLLFPLNFFRVYLVLLAAISFSPNAAETLHIATWFLTSAAILLVWYYLTKRVAKAKEFSELL